MWNHYLILFLIDCYSKKHDVEIKKSRLARKGEFWCSLIDSELILFRLLVTSQSLWCSVVIGNTRYFSINAAAWKYQEIQTIEIRWFKWLIFSIPNFLSLHYFISNLKRLPSFKKSNIGLHDTLQRLVFICQICFILTRNMWDFFR